MPFRGPADPQAPPLRIDPRERHSRARRYANDALHISDRLVTLHTRGPPVNFRWGRMIGHPTTFVDVAPGLKQAVHGSSREPTLAGWPPDGAGCPDMKDMHTTQMLGVDG